MGENLKFLFVGQGRDVCVEAPASSYDIFELEKAVPSWVAGVPHQDTIPSRALLFTTYTAWGAAPWTGLFITWACFLYLLVHSSIQPQIPPFCLSTLSLHPSPMSPHSWNQSISTSKERLKPAGGFY